MEIKNIKVCCGNKCQNKGAVRILDVLETSFPEDKVEMVGCVDYCEQGPNTIVDNKIYHNSRTNDIVRRIMNDEGIILKPPTISDSLINGELL